MTMVGDELARLIELLSRLPGLGPRSARRAALALVQRRESLMRPLARALEAAAREVEPCGRCGNLDSHDPCAICRDPKRDPGLICVVETVGDVWAFERGRVHDGTYHVLGGTLSALDGVTEADLGLDSLRARAADPRTRELVLALPATVDGQATAHLIAETLADLDIRMSRLAQGVPMGGELDHLDDGTLAAALRARRPAG